MNEFWPRPRWSKIDELEEQKHAYLWKRALVDPMTGIEKLNSDYIIYGPQEGLLFRPKRMVVRVGLDLYDKMLQVFGRD